LGKQEYSFNISYDVKACIRIRSRTEVKKKKMLDPYTIDNTAKSTL
jgi:hypothetical protein